MRSIRLYSVPFRPFAILTIRPSRMRDTNANSVSTEGRISLLTMIQVITGWIVLRLKLFSGQNKSQQFVDDLTCLIGLEPTKVQEVVRFLVDVAANPIRPFILTGDLAKKLEIEESQADRIVLVAFTVAARMLSGMNGKDIQDDLVAKGFMKEKVEQWFTAIEHLSATEKETVRYYSISGEAMRQGHWHRIGSSIDLRAVVDNGFVVGVVPIVAFRIRTHRRGQKEEEVILLDMTFPEIGAFVSAFQTAAKELETTEKNLKERLGVALATRPAGV